MKNRNIDWKTKLSAKEILSIISMLLIAMILGVFLSSQIFVVSSVREISMENTLYERDRLIVNKLSYGFSEPERGDVVIFLKDEEVGGFFVKFWRGICDVFNRVCRTEKNNRLVKRVIGLPGETIEFRDGAVYINGIELIEDYTAGPTGSAVFSGKMHIPDGFYFVMGDNRIFSGDSRHFGPVAKESIEGKALTVIWPLSEWKSLRTEYDIQSD